MPVDLDEPRVEPPEDRRDVGYVGCNPGTIQSKLRLAKVASASATPADCLEQIRTQPGEESTPVESGMTLCFVTDANAAATQGTTQKIVFLTVDAFSVESDRGVLNFTVTAWNVPK